MVYDFFEPKLLSLKKICQNIILDMWASFARLKRVYQKVFVAVTFAKSVTLSDGNKNIDLESNILIIKNIKRKQNSEIAITNNNIINDYSNSGKK